MSLPKDLTLQGCIAWAEDYLRERGFENVRSEARLLLGAELGVSLETILAHPDRLVSVEAFQGFQEKIHRRGVHEPVSRILGRREFWSLSFELSPETLDPRPDSETLIETVLSLKNDSEAPLRVLDLGTGSGCLLLSLLSEYPKAWGLGVDRSWRALETAMKNARGLGLENRASFLQGDWVSGIQGAFDVVISNPPYIPKGEISGLSPDVMDYDPMLALDGGKDGLSVYRHLAREIPRLLAPEGIAVIEIGQGQGPAVQDLFEARGVICQGWRKDLSGIKRCGVFLGCAL